MTEEELKKVKVERPVLTCEEAAELIKQHCCPYYPDKVDGTRWETVMHMAIEALKERKTGKWITERIGIRSYATKCSACGNVLHRGHNFDSAQQYTEYVNGSGGYDKFCHECGAKMEVDE